MNELERQIANNPIPQVSPELDARISALFRTREREGLKQGCFQDSIDASSIEPLSVKRYSRMNQMLIRIALVTSAVILIAMTMSLMPNIGIQAVAFGQVKDSVGQVKTVSYLVETTFVKDANGKEPSLELEQPFVTLADIQERVNFLQTKLKAREIGELERAERNAELSTIQRLLVDGAPSLSILCWQRISGRERCRTETVLPKGEGIMQVSIFNGRVGKHIAREDNQKQFYNLSTFLITNGTKSQKHPDSTANFFDDIMSISEKDAERLPEKVIDGRLVIGYSIKFGVTLTKTYWIDKASRLPVRIEEMASDGVFSTQTVLSAFTYDAPLDEALFDVNIPEGYEVHDLETTFSNEAIK